MSKEKLFLLEDPFTHDVFDLRMVAQRLRFTFPYNNHKIPKKVDVIASREADGVREVYRHLGQTYIGLLDLVGGVPQEGLIRIQAQLDSFQNNRSFCRLYIPVRSMVIQQFPTSEQNFGLPDILGLTALGILGTLNAATYTGDALRRLECIQILSGSLYSYALFKEHGNKFDPLKNH